MLLQGQPGLRAAARCDGEHGAATSITPGTDPTTDDLRGFEMVSCSRSGSRRGIWPSHRHVGRGLHLVRAPLSNESPSPFDAACA